MKKEKNLLIVEDDQGILEALAIALEGYFTTITKESDPRKIPFLLDKKFFDLVFLDMNYETGAVSGKEGLFWAKEIRVLSPKTKIVAMTAYGDIQLAVEAMKLGAADFITKPWEIGRLQVMVQNLIEVAGSEKDSNFSQNHSQRYGQIGAVTTPMIGKSKTHHALKKVIDKVAPTEASILILGENGVGKEVVAERLHQSSSRKDQPFIKVDLGALANNLFESELFGHKKGAFTDAKEDKVGRFQQAHKGTIFLDEIGNLSMDLQKKLLSVLQDGIVTPLGSDKSYSVDVRLLSATNINLSKEIERHAFREDLYYRINTLEIEVPPLRQRPEDIGALCSHFLTIYTEKYRKGNLTMSKSTLDYLMRYSWPGNVRELNHAMERAVILSNGMELQKSDFYLGKSKSEVRSVGSVKMEELEKEAIQVALKNAGGNVSMAAKALGLGRTTLYRKMTKYEL